MQLGTQLNIMIRKIQCHFVKATLHLSISLPGFLASGSSLVECLYCRDATHAHCTFKLFDAVAVSLSFQHGPGP